MEENVKIDFPQFYQILSFWRMFLIKITRSLQNYFIFLIYLEYLGIVSYLVYFIIHSGVDLSEIGYSRSECGFRAWFIKTDYYLIISSIQFYFTIYKHLNVVVLLTYPRKIVRRRYDRLRGRM